MLLSGDYVYAPNVQEAEIPTGHKRSSLKYTSFVFFQCTSFVFYQYTCFLSANPCTRVECLVIQCTTLYMFDGVRLCQLMGPDTAILFLCRRKSCGFNCRRPRASEDGLVDVLWRGHSCVTVRVRPGRVCGSNWMRANDR